MGSKFKVGDQIVVTKRNLGMHELSLGSTLKVLVVNISGSVLTETSDGSFVKILPSELTHLQVIAPIPPE